MSVLEKNQENYQIVRDLFRKIDKLVRVKENYIKPDYNQFGGMWSKDVYELNDTKIMVSDAGYVTTIFNPNVHVVEKPYFNDDVYEFYVGNIEDLKTLYNNLKRG